MFGGGCGVGPDAGQNVLVGLPCEGDVGVTEPLGHDLDGDAFLDEQAPAGVTQVVEMHGGNAGVCRRLAASR